MSHTSQLYINMNHYLALLQLLPSDLVHNLSLLVNFPVLGGFLRDLDCSSKKKTLFSHESFHCYLCSNPLSNSVSDAVFVILSNTIYCLYY